LVNLIPDNGEISDTTKDVKKRGLPGAVQAQHQLLWFGAKVKVYEAPVIVDVDPLQHPFNSNPLSPLGFRPDQTQPDLVRARFSFSRRVT
jgi:hypothetical protein